MSNINSEHIEVFPAGFRGNGYGQSKLFTENNITYLRLLSSHKENNSAIFINPYDSTKVVILLGGYLFNIDKVDIDDCISSTANMYAVIRVRATAQNSENYVLCPVEGTSTTLDVADDSSVLFKGLLICTSAEKDAITEDTTHKVYSIKISDSYKSLITKNFRLYSDEIEDGESGQSIADCLTTVSLNADTVTTEEYIGEETITEGALASSAVTTAKINDGAVTAAKIANEAVTTAKINDGAVTADKIAPNAVTTAKINASAVTADKIADDAVTANKLANEAVNTDNIVSSAVTTAKIAKEAVTTDKIADGAITSSKLSVYETEDEVEGGYSILCKCSTDDSLIWSYGNKSTEFNLKVNSEVPSCIFDTRITSTLNINTGGKLSSTWESSTNTLTLTGEGSTVSTSSTQGNISVDEEDVPVEGLTTNDSPTFKGLTIKSINDEEVEYSSDIYIEAGHNSTKGNLVIESNSKCNIQLKNGVANGKTSLLFYDNGHETGSVDFSKDTLIFNSIVNDDTCSAIFKYDSSTNDEHFTMDKSLTISGKCTANSFLATSDIRKKTNITPFTAEKSILDLNVYKYDYINDGTTHIGCIAQELKTICPELVHEDSEGYLSIEESKLVYLLIDEVKKLKEEVNKLKGE